MRSIPLVPDSPGHSQRFCELLAGLEGFVCIGAPAPTGRSESPTWISAEPARVFSFDTAGLQHVNAVITQAMAGLDPSARVAGVVDYDAAYGLEKSLKPPRAPWSSTPVRAALYAWWVELGPAISDIRLCLTHECTAAAGSRIKQFFDLARDPSSVNSEPFRTAEFIAETPHKDYLEAVRKVQRYILAGDCYQVNLSHRFQARYAGSLWQAYRALCERFPSPHSGFVSQGGETVVSISPESFLEIGSGRIRTRPIKGTRPRGDDETSDRNYARELQESPKDRAENLMIVDLLRNDLGRFSETGSVQVDALMALESFRNVHHLVSTVSSRLKSGVSPFETFLGCFPGGSITGAPKIRAMEIIAELESGPRGPYCGSLFWLNGNGDLYSNIAIRTLYARGRTLYCHGGGGIVADSEPEAEYQETLVKVGPLMNTLACLNKHGE